MIKYVKFDANGWGMYFDLNPHSDKEIEALRNNFATDKPIPTLLKLDSLNRVTLKTAEQRAEYDAEQYEIRVNQAVSAVKSVRAGDVVDALNSMGQAEVVNTLMANPLFSIYSYELVLKDERVIEFIDQIGEELTNNILRYIVTKRGI